MVMNGGSYFNLHRNLRRTTSEEKRDLECLEKPMYDSLRQAVKVHCQVRKYMRSIIKPGMLMVDLCENLENIVFGTLSASGRCIPYRKSVKMEEVGKHLLGLHCMITLHW